MTQIDTEKNITVNRKARHEFFIIQTFEAGIVLVGTEVKALRNNNANLVDSYAAVKNGEVWLFNAHIGPFEQGNIQNHEPKRKRKLLLKKSEIKKIVRSILEKGNTLVPLRLYFKNSLVKVELGVAKGKKFYDKREDIAKRDAKRDLDRKMKY